MNAITKALSEIHISIPREILNLAFIEKNNVNEIISMDERILNSVFRPYLLVDANLVGGMERKIDLSRCTVSNLRNGEYIIQVPDKVIHNKKILSVYSLEMSNMQQYRHINSMYSSGGSVLNAANQMFDSVNDTSYVQTSRLELIGNNTVIVQEPMVHPGYGLLRVQVENNNNLSNISPRAYIEFSKMAVLCVKRYIYNKIDINLSKGYIYSGHELSTVKDKVSQYSDAEELYYNALRKWKKISFANDKEAIGDYIQGMI